MLELVYPLEPLPVIFGSSTGPASEMLPVIEPSGLVAGQASRNVCHERSLLHPVVRLLVLDRSGRFFFQKRSASKELFPSLWDDAVTGHVVFGENLSEALYREAAEEIGLRQFHPQHLATYLCNEGGEREMVNLYAAVGEFNLDPHNDEVECGRWWTADEVEKSLDAGEFTPGMVFDWKNFKDKALALL